ncbi:antibiotic biosynthesis monooxygenase [Vibrio breoganii]|uniref:putative quinol monooxygenase n=1 Tax=Vibrio breoganii TaxID=553239 RepID=UPI0010BD4C05|nr:antibiotic biosynthesis monooxygenase [Vibrio breoganii]TKF87041.1 antibiotic biosynthesis monooxygenase [Vibrio breoganii]
MSKVTLEGHIIVPVQDLKPILEALPEHIELTHAEPGCIRFHVQQSSKKPHRFDVYEEFIDKEAFEYHQRRVEESHWGAITSNVIRHYQVSEESE